MTTLPEPTVRATRYEVCALPETGINARCHTIAVVYCGNGFWSVQRDQYTQLDAAGVWSMPPDWPSGREPETSKERDAYYSAKRAWIAAHRHDLETALRLAREAAPNAVANGRLPDGTFIGLHPRAEGGT